MKYTSQNPITTQVQGYLLDPMKNALSKYTIIAEATDSKGSALQKLLILKVLLKD